MILAIINAVAALGTTQNDEDDYIFTSTHRFGPYKRYPLLGLRVILGSSTPQLLMVYFIEVTLCSYYCERRGLRARELQSQKSQCADHPSAWAATGPEMMRGKGTP